MAAELLSHAAVPLISTPCGHVLEEALELHSVCLLLLFYKYPLKGHLGQLLALDGVSCTGQVCTPDLPCLLLPTVSLSLRCRFSPPLFSRMCGFLFCLF